MYKLISILLIATTCYSEELPFDKTRDTPYTYEEVQQTFIPILSADVRDIFLQLTPVFFHEAFGKSPHGAKGLIDCWNCYYNTLRNFSNQENVANLQLREIFHRMGDHAKRIYAVAPELYPVLKELESKMQRLFPEDKDILWHELPEFTTEAHPVTETAPPQPTYLETAAGMLKGAMLWFFK
ncbi:MAG: hypothetical protein KF820_06540 [Candidatus Paracaedibacteraceae bacterium]|nr:hypothetical protein [Candidatus Paracaedibacteraceae bacterium]